MKNYLYVVFWLIIVLCSSGYYGQSVGNPDNTEKIERPCPVYDLNCIRDFFESHAHCKKTYGPVPDPITRAQDNLYLSRINITASAVDQKINGLNGRVEEFYINRATGKLVIAVEFQNMTHTTDNLYFIFHRRAKEPVVTVTPSSVTYDSLVITAIFPNIDDLKLNEAECTTFLSNPISLIRLSPSAAISSDPQTAVSFANFFTNMAANVQEFFLTDSAYFIATYIQYTICDFGLFLT